MNAYQSILPEFDVFTSPGPIRAPKGGQMLGGTPARRAAAFMMSPGAHAMRGFGQSDTAPPAIPAPVVPPAPKELPVWAALLVIGVFGYASYEVGKAIAPSGSNKTTWGLIAAPLGLFLGPIGLGGMAIYRNHWRAH